MHDFRSHKTIVSCLLILACSLLAPAFAQSWSAWKQVAEEQASKGDLAKAEDAWKASLTLAQEKGLKDARVYVSALELAKLQKTEKKADESRKLLRSVCSDELAKLDFISDEELSCIQTYLDLSKEAQDSGETNRVEKLLIEVRKKQNSAAASPSNNQVSILFGAAAEDEMKKKLARAQQLVSQKNYAEAEKALDDCFKDSTAQHNQQTMQTLLTEQLKIFDATKDYKKAEKCAKQLVDIAKQLSGSESKRYVDALTTHAKLLRQTGQTEQAGLEETLIGYTNNKLASYKAVPTVPSKNSSSPSGGGPAKPIQLHIDPSFLVGNYHPPAALTVGDLMALADRSDDINLLKFVAKLLYQNHDYKSCLPYVEKLARLQPDVRGVQILLCGLYIETQRPSDAVSAAKRAVFLQSDATSDAVLINAYEAAGDMEHNRSALKDFISHYPSDENTPSFITELNHLEKALVAAEKTENSDSTEEEKMKCWKKRGVMPIRIFLADNTTKDQVVMKADGTGAIAPRELCQQALDAWASASGGRISFTLVPDERVSQISICYSYESDAILSENSAAGLTRWTMQPIHATVSLGLVDKKGVAIKRDVFYATALHEIGHSLGLDHSKRAEDVMYWQQHSVEPTEPSTNDQRRICRLYDN